MSEPPVVTLKTKIVGFLILVVGLSVAGLAYYQDLSYKRYVNDFVQNQASVPTPSVLVLPNTSPTPLPSVIVRYENEQSIPADVKEKLFERVVAPLADYYKESQPENKIQSVTISVNSSATAKDYPYLASVDFDGEINLSFVIEKSGSSFAWWKPECLNGCKFSDEYAKKYPDVTKK